MAAFAHTVEERGGRVGDFAVLEQGELLTRKLMTRFGPAVKAEKGARLLVIAPGACALRAGETLRCHTVLLPGEQRDLLTGICARGAVSYGLSGRDTITLSSREGRRMWVAVQRELVRLDGTVLERQELPVRIPGWADEMLTLALAGAMLLLGAQTWELEFVEQTFPSGGRCPSSQTGADEGQ